MQNYVFVMEVNELHFMFSQHYVQWDILDCYIALEGGGGSQYKDVVLPV